MPNLAPEFVGEIERRLGIPFCPEGDLEWVASHPDYPWRKNAQNPVTCPHPGDLEIARRHLPHWTLEGSTYFITFRLKEGILSEEERTLVLSHVQRGHSRFYSLLAAVVMPDHVHLILRPNSGVALGRIMKGIKGVSARLLNARRGTRGLLWLGESFDRIVRDEDELLEKMDYMVNNPAKAGLVENGWDYRWLLCCGDQSTDGNAGTDEMTGRNACPTSGKVVLTPEDVFHYAYAVFLKIDFPRVPEPPIE